MSWTQRANAFSSASRRLRRRRVNLRDIEDRMPRGANLRRQIPSVLVQGRGLPVHYDLSIRHHAPDHLDRLIAAQRIPDQHRLPLRHRESPQPLFHSARIGPR